eukprot:sb/3471141/
MYIDIAYFEALKQYTFSGVNVALRDGVVVVDESLKLTEYYPPQYAILLDHWRAHGTVLSPEEVNKREQFITGRSLPVTLGASLLNFSGPLSVSDRDYVIFNSKKGVNVALRDGVNDAVILESYYHAYQELNPLEATKGLSRLTLRSALRRNNSTKGLNYEEFRYYLEAEGWDLSFAPLGATGVRYRVDN